MDLSLQAKDVAEAKAKYDHAKELLDELKGDYDFKRFQLLQGMTAQGIKSMQADKYLAVRAHRINIDILDESAAIDWLQHQEVEADFYIGLKKELFLPLARTALKKDGEVPAGCELRTDEYLTLRSNNG